MKTSTKKSSTTTSSTITQATNQPFFAKAGGGSFFAPVAQATASTVQMKMTVNKPGDKFEQEADNMADNVMRMPTPESRGQDVQRQAMPEEEAQRQEAPEEDVQKQEEEDVQRQAMPEEEAQRQEAPEEDVQKQEEEDVQRQARPEEEAQRQAAPEEDVQKQEEEDVQRQEDELQRKGNGTPAVHADTRSSIQNKMTGGQPLSADVRGHMESRFGADFSNVRIHSDTEAASLSNRLSAQAFTYQNHIFFSRDQYQPGTSGGQRLLAHELTHTIQQGHAAQRSPQVSTTTTPPPVQRLGVQDALDYFADKAYYIPGFRMLTIVLGFNPINMRSTDRSAANILRALIELVPGGRLITQALENHGVFTKAGEWVETQLATLGDIGSDIADSLRRFLDSLGWSDIFDLGGVWDRAKRIFTNPINRLISFAGSVVTGIMKLVKEAVLRPLAAMAEGTRGYDLLKAVLGEDPITGDPVPRNAETLIGGFMKLIGREDIWENIQKGNAIARAWAWFQGALSGLMAFVRAIPGQIVAIFTSLTWQDVISVVGVFTKVGRAFLNIAGQFISWAGQQVLSLLEIILVVVAPGAVPYLKKAKGAFNTIIQNPIGFVGNLVRAGKLGFQMFASRIGEHLKAALIKWIVGPLGAAGVYIPKSFSLMEIIKLVLSVLGLTWQNIRAKLVKIIPEPVLAGLEKTVGILVTLVKDGPVAAWEQIKEELSELKDSLITQITEMITTEVVKAAVVKVASMLNPAGAVIQAIIAIYKTISFFIQKINQIGAVVGSFINSISAIAAGNVTNAAKRVEQTLANTLTLVIAFMAKFVGLGNVPEKIVGIIKRIRQPIDKGLDKIVVWLGKMLKKLAGGVKGIASRLVQWWKKRTQFTDIAGQSHNIYFKGEASNAELVVESTVMVVRDAINLARPKAATNAQKQAVSDANSLRVQAEGIIRRLQSQRQGAYDPNDIDSINATLNQLANVMKILVPLIAGPTATSPSSLPVVVGDLISYNGRHWIIHSFDKVQNLDMVRIKRLVPAIKAANAEGHGLPGFAQDLQSGRVIKISDKLTRRELFMGSTPGKTSGVGNAVKARMQALGKYNPTTNKFLNARDNTWYPLSQADMGHVIDASVWWNSNGRFKGPKAPEVIQFMTDSDNYEFEESSQNQSRGAASPNYLPPAT